MSRDHVKKCVLAYSGGLDTSVIIRWLIENYGCEVIAFSANLGGGEDLAPLKKKAIQTGASKIVIKDLREEFLEQFCFPAMQAGALYEGRYPMHTSLGRPLIAKYLVEVARQEGADAIAHGCTGKGNDQVRFEVTSYALAPDLKVIAPVREWDMKTREEEIEYARRHKIPVTATAAKPFSYDVNIWGAAIECGVLEDPWAAPPEEAYVLTQSPLKAPDKPEEITIGFERGRPVKLNGRAMKSVRLVEELNRLGGRHGVGRLDLVENRLVGIKSREVYENPAAVILHTALRDLESLCLDRDTAHFKETVAPRYAELIYYGLWYSPLREALAAFVDKTQEFVSGDVRVQLHKGRVTVTGKRSPYSLYIKALATYEKGDAFKHSSAEGFIDIFGLPLRVHAQVQKRTGALAKKAGARRTGR
ncbi:MAG: argininosuccinate synthase [Candidatus Sumerlaeia bacterium]